MPVQQTIRRAEHELASGNISSARQRMRGLVASCPHEPAARALLAETYRRTGDHVQAGRWAYATETATDGELDAFARGFGRDPVRMMRALRWTGSEDDAPSDAVRDRLHALRTRAEEAAGEPVSWEDPSLPRSRDSALACVGLAALVAFLVVCLLVGLVTIARFAIGLF